MILGASGGLRGENTFQKRAEFCIFLHYLAVVCITSANVSENSARFCVALVKWTDSDDLTGVWVL